MSKTRRKIIRNKRKDNPLAIHDNGFCQSYEEVVVDDTQVKFQKERTGTKMKPYSKNSAPKYDAVTYMVQGPGRERKLKIKNANRSLKKGERQRLKRQLKKEIDNNATL